MSGERLNKKPGTTFGLFEEIDNKIICPICGKRAFSRRYNEFKRLYEYKHITKVGKAKAELTASQFTMVTRATYCEQKLKVKA